MSTDIARLSDDELRRELFDELVARMEAINDPQALVINRTPHLFSLSRHGHLLTVHRGEDDPRLLHGQVEWAVKYEKDEPWTFAVRRSPDRSKLLYGTLVRTMDEVLDDIVRTFLEQAQ